MQYNGLIAEQCTLQYSGILEVLGDRQADRSRYSSRRQRGRKEDRHRDRKEEEERAAEEKLLCPLFHDVISTVKYCNATQYRNPDKEIQRQIEG